MRPDIDAMFDALASRADRIPAPSERAVRARGNRRRLVHRTATAVAACVVTSAVAVSATLYSGLLRDGTAADAPGRFTPLVEVGPARNGRALGSTRTIAVVDGDNGFLAEQKEYAGVGVTAVNLRTGAVRWRARVEDATSGGGRVAVAPSGMVVIGGAERDLQHAITVLDPDSGRQLWRQTVSLDTESVELYQTVAVYGSTSEGRLTGLDLTTGGTLWSVPFTPGESLVPVRSEDDLADPGRADVESGNAYGGDVVATVALTGQLRVLDIQTGRLVATGEVPAATVDLAAERQYHASGQRLYLTTGGTRFQVRAYDLGTGLDLGTVYRASADDATFVAMTTCGTDRFCLAEGGPSSTTVVSVDLTTRREAWRRPAPGATALVPVGDGVVATGGTAALYLDRDGRDLLANANAGTGGARAHSGGALFYRTVPGGTALEGVTAAGVRTRIGQVPADLETCAWNRRAIICPTTEEYGVWRFAG